MKKSIRYGLSIIVSLIILIIALWYAPFTPNSVKNKAAQGVLKVISKTGIMTGHQKIFVPLYNAEFGIKSVFVKEGYIKQKGIYISNPKNFGKGNLFETDTITIAVDVDSMTTEKIIIKKIIVDGARLYIDEKTGTSNVGYLFAGIIDFINKNKDEIFSSIESLQFGEDIGEIQQKLGKLVFGQDERLMKKSLKQMLRSNAVMFGGNPQIIARLEKVNSRLDAGEDAAAVYAEEMNYWAEKTAVIDKIEFKNFSIIDKGKVYKIPSLKLSNVDFSEFNSLEKSPSMIANEKALEDYATVLNNKKDEYKDLEETFLGIKEEVKTAFQMFMMQMFLEAGIREGLSNNMELPVE